MGKKRIIAKPGESNNSGANGEGIRLQKKSSKRKVFKGTVYIHASYNNTIITITDTQGGTITWASSGNTGFSGTRKSTPYAATTAARIAAEKAKSFGLAEVTVYVKGVGPGRDAAIRGIASAGIELNAIIDATPIPHNGCKPAKPRRV
ncbi:MAG: 30S ribosomal protein S11 [Parcubacteria group bacterium]|nr:30S ribosomal protein S11 [Parcubacteria group bacterium]